MCVHVHLYVCVFGVFCRDFYCTHMYGLLLLLSNSRLVAVSLDPLSPYPSGTSNIKGAYISGHESWIKITEPITGQPAPTNKQDFMVERQRKVFIGFIGYEDACVSLSTASQQRVSGLWVYEPFIIRLFVEKERVSEHRRVPWCGCSNILIVSRMILK